MKWVLFAVGGLVGLVGLMALIGALLPKTHVSQVRASYGRDAATVWGTIVDFAAWPSWNRAVKSMTRLPDVDGRAVWLIKDGNGEMPSKVVEAQAPEGDQAGKLVTCIDDPKLPFGGTWTWQVRATPSGTEVSIREEGEIRNPLFRFLARVVFGYTGTATEYLKALGGRFGEEVAPRAGA